MLRNKELIQRRTTLSANLLMLFRYLRGHGFILGPEEEALALRALVLIDPWSNPEALRTCLRAALCRTRGQQLAFDELYTQFWQELEKAVDSKIVDQEEEEQGKRSGKGQQDATVPTIKDWLQGDQNKEITETATYSADAGLIHKDFSLFSSEELAEIWEIVQKLAKSMAMRMGRRWARSHRKNHLDLKRTLRRNLRCGGELLELEYQRPRQNRHRIILLCDVSKSMDLYSRFLIQFVYAFQQVYRRIETFIFSTELYRITASLQKGAYEEAMDEFKTALPGWSGGTRIGHALHTFTRDYRRLLNQQTTVLILSDGWDTGDERLLERSMRHMYRRAAQVIWLNPLAGNPEFRPEVKGMQAAMPYIDVFASGHNIASLRELVRHLR